MFITNHALAGALVGHALARRPVTAAAVGVVSHLVMDACLHFGREDVDWEDFLRVAKVDGTVGLGVCAAALAVSPARARPAVAAGIFGACLPDMDKVGRWIGGRSPFPHWFDRFHGRIQTEHVTGALVEVAVAAVLTAVLFGPRPGTGPIATAG